MKNENIRVGSLVRIVYSADRYMGQRVGLCIAPWAESSNKGYIVLIDEKRLIFSPCELELVQ